MIPHGDTVLANQATKFFTTDEVVMLRFLAMSQPSPDPQRYAAVEDACRYLCDTRRSFSRDSLDRCLRHISFGS